jgi:transcriptional regulator with XRE-family HTH domain
MITTDIKAIGAYIGKRIRARRLKIGMPQEELGKAFGVSFQQVQKYEKGTSKVTVERLYELSEALGIGVPYFLPDITLDLLNDNTRDQLEELSEPQKIVVGESSDIVKPEEVNELIALYLGIVDTAIRRQIISLVRHFSYND